MYQRIKANMCVSVHAKYVVWSCHACYILIVENFAPCAKAAVDMIHACFL